MYIVNPPLFTKYTRILLFPPFKSTLSLVNFAGLTVLKHIIINITTKERFVYCKDYGFKLHIPENSLPRGRTHCNITITVALSGEFQFPENSVLVSAIYELTTDLKEDFAKPLTLRIQHCAQENVCKALKLVTATSNTPLPYSFHCSQDGLFMSQDSYGDVTLQHFSLFAIVAWLKESVCHLIWGPQKYCAQIYYTKGRDDGFCAHIFIVKDLAADLQVSYMHTYNQFKLGSFISVNSI